MTIVLRQFSCWSRRHPLVLCTLPAASFAQLRSVWHRVAQLAYALSGLLFALARTAVAALRRTAGGTAYLARAMLSDQAGDWNAARGYLRKAIRFHPLLLRDPSVCRRLIKLSLGQRVVGRICSVHTANE